MGTGTYTFDSGNEGWRVYDEDSDSFLGGSLHNSFFGGAQIADNEEGTTPWFATPTDFSGDNSMLVGGSLSFDYRNADAEPFVDDDISSIDVMLVGADGTKLTASISITPTTGTITQSVSFDLDAATFGVSEAVFDSVMADLSFIGINADARSTQESTIIDNVVIASDPDAVDGSESGETMDLGFVDDDGDQITSGDDVILGNGGDDDISGGGGADHISGGAGDDTIDGGDGSDTIFGGDGADTIDGGSQSDVIYGGEGDDYIDGGWYTDTLDGGEGNDTVSFQNSFGTTSEYVVVDLTTETAALNGGASGVESITNFENVEGSQGDDTITGDSGDNRLEGKGGDDTIYGGDGADYIVGGDGADTLYGGDGDDTIDTFTGSKPWESNSESRTDTVDAGAGDDLIFGGFGGGESFDGGTGTDTFDLTNIGTNSPVTLDLSAETFDLGSGSSTITNIENVVGTWGADSITGDINDNVLDGHFGDDTLTGGGGDDTFVMSHGGGNDTITDFDRGDDDGDGFTNDQLDVSDLTTLSGDPIRAKDVVVTDDGSGNAVLNFPNGETLTLQGVAPAELDTEAKLVAMGVPCFTAGTLIQTPEGEVPVEMLVPGDLVITKDAGPQPLRWTATTHLDRATLDAHPHLKPVLIPEGVLGNHSKLLVSPQHCMLLPRPRGRGPERLARAKHLAEAPGAVRVAKGRPQVTYVHLLFDTHQILYSNGAASESYYPGDQAIRNLHWSDLARLCTFVPGLGTQPIEQLYGPRARPVVRRHEIGDLLRKPASARQDAHRKPDALATLCD